MWKELFIALLGALVGTYFGTFFLSKREELKVKKVRRIAIRALKIIANYSKHNGTYDKACQELNANLKIAEKRAVIVALHTNLDCLFGFLLMRLLTSRKSI